MQLSCVKADKDIGLHPFFGVLVLCVKVKILINEVFIIIWKQNFLFISSQDHQHTLIMFEVLNLFRFIDFY